MFSRPLPSSLCPFPGRDGSERERARERKTPLLSYSLRPEKESLCYALEVTFSPVVHTIHSIYATFYVLLVTYLKKVEQLCGFDLISIYEHEMTEKFEKPKVRI